MLLRLADISFTYRYPPLLEDVGLGIAKGERIGLLGRNGEGKSTLLKLIAGELKPDHGELVRQEGVVVVRLDQEVPPPDQRPIAELVLAGAEAHRRHACEHQGAQPLEEWEFRRGCDRAIRQLQLDSEATFSELSSGMKRRVVLAQALAAEPDVLLLDEPTNHLDLGSILWLEGFLKSFAGTLMFITHDRAFLRSLATRILEVDRGRLFDWTCDYETFLKRKAAALQAEAREQELFDRRLAEEEAWIRQGIKARRTRNEGRVRALKEMRAERRFRRSRLGDVRMNALTDEQSGRIVAKVEHVSFEYDQRPILTDFSTLILRGDRIGIIGPNGAGKSTLLKLILGQLEPQTGSIEHGARLQILYFDQLREQIDGEATVADNVGEGQTTLLIGGKQKHIFGYLQEFLFTPDRARQKAKFLSGGERNRLLLARLFKRPSNVLVLDEPTNDLDAETLELLEELLLQYQGTLLVVSHDRAFLNNVVTSTLVLEGNGTVKEYDGGFDDYLRQAGKELNSLALGTGMTTTSEKETKTAAASKPKSTATNRLSYNEQRELKVLPQQIETLEAELAELQTAMSAPEFFQQDGQVIAAASKDLSDKQATLHTMYERWEELEARVEG